MAKRKKGTSRIARGRGSNPKPNLAISVSMSPSATKGSPANSQVNRLKDHMARCINSLILAPVSILSSKEVGPSRPNDFLSGWAGLRKRASKPLPARQAAVKVGQIAPDEHPAGCCKHLALSELAHQGRHGGSLDPTRDD